MYEHDRWAPASQYYSPEPGEHCMYIYANATEENSMRKQSPVSL